MARSTFDPGPPPVLQVPDVVSYVSRPGGEFSTMVVSAGIQGFQSVTFGIFKADGRDNRLYDATSLATLASSGTPRALGLTRAYRPLGNGAYEAVAKTNGVVTSRRRISVSPDGNIMTQVNTLVNAAGEVTATNTLVYERLTPRTGRPPTN